MKITFFGTPLYVVPIVDTLHKTYNRGRERQLLAVVTQPPKPTGRDKKVEHSEVDHWAYKHKLPIAVDINETPEADLGVLAAYGQIIPQEVIDRFEHGILNIHPSALPQFRGASPVQATLLTGNDTATVTVMKMDNLMDHGPIVSTFSENILPEDTTETLRTRLFERAAEFMIELIPNYVSGKIKPKEQDHDKATYTRSINKQDGFIEPEFIEAALLGEKHNIDWEIRWIKECILTPDAITIGRFIRAMYPWPIAWTHVYTSKASQEQKRLKIIKAHVEGEKLVLDRVQLEGKNEVSWKEFTNGYPEYHFN